MTVRTYLGNLSLKAAGVQIEYTQEQAQEYARCKNDPIYFIKNYCKIVSLDHGVILFKMHPYQERLVDAIHKNKKVIAKLGRQLGKSTAVAGYITWYVLFNDHKKAGILANKQSTAVEIFGRVQFMIEHLPMWLQQGVLEWNKRSLVLENGSKCVASATSASAVRGESYSFLLCDEFAHLHPNLAEEFIASVFPTISSSESSKLVIVSTPNGLNHYYKIWNDAEKGKNGYVAISGHWSENPYRSQKWADEQKVELGEVKYAQEVECNFQSSSYTLIDGYKLSTLTFEEPIFSENGLYIFYKPESNRQYVTTVDVSRGRHQDFSAFSVFDVTEMPYRVVAAFKDNTISTMEYPHLIVNTCKQYNDARALVELNDLGEDVANTIWYDLEYENVFFCKKTELVESEGLPGITTSAKVKNLGCSVLKDLIEKDQLQVTSFKIIEELSRFVLQKKTYAANDTLINDDLCTTLWLFAWLTKQPLFQELTNTSLGILSEEKKKQIEESMTPFKFFSNTVTVEKPNNMKLPDKDDPYYLTEDQKWLIGG